MKPIEPGCLVMLIQGPDTGKTMTAIRLAGTDGFETSFPGEPIANIGQGRIWEVSEPLPWGQIYWNRVIRKIPYAPEEALMRIDDYDEEQHNDTQHDLERPVSGALRRTSYAD